MVSSATIAVLLLDVILGIVVPIALAWWLVRKYKVNLSTILIGAATFVVFALLLESVLHNIVLKGPSGEAIRGNTLYYALYGGLAAGIFEEVGRFLSMKFLMLKEPSKVAPGIAYGVGHGGVEMLFVFGIGMFSTLMMAFMINSGQINDVMAQVPAEARQQLQSQITQLTTDSSGSYLLGLWERFSAIVLQLSLSVLVWAAVRKGGKWLWLFPAAILIHAFVDGSLVMMKDSISMFALEAICTVYALACAALAYFVARRCFQTEKA